MQHMQTARLRFVAVAFLSLVTLSQAPVARAECTDTNTCFGLNALPSNSGARNTAIGFEALFLNEYNDNTALGYRALSSNTSGFENTALGVNALRKNTRGALNVDRIAERVIYQLAAMGGILFRHSLNAG